MNKTVSNGEDTFVFWIGEKIAKILTPPEEGKKYIKFIVMS